MLPGMFKDFLEFYIILFKFSLIYLLSNLLPFLEDAIDPAFQDVWIGVHQLILNIEQ